ncbi:MAG TPA: TetR/AcrR family transcriptional regulator, partial [Solirubrobacteraceae bacterium]
GPGPGPGPGPGRAPGPATHAPGPATDTPARDRVPTRDRILYASAELFRRQGYAGTGLKQISVAADAPFGSLYHFFPGGKEQLADEVLRTGGRFFLALYEAIAGAAPNLEAAVRDFFAGAAQTLVATDYADACPVATVAGEIASTHEVLRVATADVFESWLGAVVDDAVEAGIPPDRARPLAVSVLALLEGAFLLSRSLRSIEPMEASAEAALALVSKALQEVTT